jgi:hypothetical protein
VNDQDAGHGAERRGQGEGDLSCARGRNADQPRPEPVDGGRAQRLAVKHAVEEEIERRDQNQRHGEDGDGLPGDRKRSEIQGRAGQRRRAQPLRAEEHEAETDHRQVHADGRDEQGQHRGVGQRLKGDAVDIRPHRRDDREREGKINPDGLTRMRQQPGQRQHRRRQQDCADDLPHDLPAGCDMPASPQLGEESGDAEHRQEPGRGRHLAGREEREGQPAIGDELALGYENDAGDRKDENEGDPQQRIDRTIEKAVLYEEEQNDAVDHRAPPRRRRPGGRGYRRVAPRPVRMPALPPGHRIFFASPNFLCIITII